MVLLEISEPIPFCNYFKALLAHVNTDFYFILFLIDSVSEVSDVIICLGDNASLDSCVSRQTILLK